MSLLHKLVLTALLAFASLAHAQSDRALDVALVCEPPISTCSFAAQDGDPLSLARPALCPPGYACACVPSCPECDDCNASVCVRARERECKTACDCELGLGCFEGQCLAGFAPVFCCDSDRCPAGEQCQHRDGSQSRCEEGMAHSCRERLERVQQAIGRLVARGARCRDDADCVQVGTTTECRGTCGEVVNRRAARRIERQVQRLNRRVCDDYQADGCPFATPSCVAVDPACIEQRCVGVPRFERPGGVSGEPLQIVDELP